jgi:hypothetical protein
LIHYLCQNVEQANGDVSVVLTNALNLGAERTLLRDSSFNYEQFASAFEYFWRMNSRIPLLYGKKPGRAWDEQFTEETNREKSKCQYRVGRQGADRILQEMRFGDIHFLGIKHFSGIKSPKEIQEANRLLDERLQSIRSTDVQRQLPPYTYILLEGHYTKYGHALSCENVLYSVFHGSREGDPDEQINLLRYGFLTHTPLIPADDQVIDDSDRDAFYGGDSKKVESLKKDFEFVDILHGYFAAWRSALGRQEPISADQALAEALAHSAYFDAESFKKRYLLENGNLLPGYESSKPSKEDPQYLDWIQHVQQRTMLSFFPSASLPAGVPIAGSNRLVDEQDTLRNRALIRAIQVSQDNFGKATVVFGSGHLEKIGSILEREIGKAKNIDFVDDCSPSPTQK